MIDLPAESDLILQLGLADGRYADAAVAAESLLAWVDLARDAARAIDPLADVRVELLGRTEGSLKQWLRIVDDHLATANAGADEYPYLKKAAIGLAIAVATSGLSTFIQESFTPDVQEVSLSSRDRQLLESMTKVIREDENTARSSQRFYRALERDPAITNVIVKNGRTDTPLVTINRAEFAIRGGLYSAAQEEKAEEYKREVWSVVLMQAPFYASSKRWRFSRDGVPFSATMTDAIFLQAIVDGTIPISLRAGVRLEVEVEWRQRQQGAVWVYMPGTRRITRVLSPRPGSSGPSANEPEEEQ